MTENLKAEAGNSWGSHFIPSMQIEIYCVLYDRVSKLYHKMGRS